MTKALRASLRLVLALAFFRVAILPVGLAAQTTFTESFNNAPDYSNNWSIQWQYGSPVVTYTPGNFRIQASNPCGTGEGIGFRSKQTFVGDVDVSFQLNHGGYGRTSVYLWSVNQNQPVIEDDLDTNDTAYLNLAAGANSTQYNYSSAPYMDKWITLRIQIVGTQVNFYADNGSGPHLLQTYSAPVSSPPDAYYIVFGAGSICWKSGGNDTSFRLIQEASPQGSLSGTISVTTNLPAATFTISGPATYTGRGASFTQTNAPEGAYTITYGPILCYGTPPAQTLTLAGGGYITFTENYQGAATVSLNVAPVGASSATFSISPPIPGLRGIPPYPVSQTGVIPQTYTVAFNQVPGFDTPQPQTLSPDSSCSLFFSGLYAPKLSTGTATISIILNTNQGGVTISSTNNSSFTPITGVGSFTTQVPAGSYQITFANAFRYYKPAPQEVALTPNDSVSVHGLYQRLLVVAFTGFNTAPTPSNCLPLIGNLNRTYNAGAGIEYTIPQTAAGMTEIVPAIAGLVPGVPGVPSLQPGITGDAFTFYGTDTRGVVNGDACTPPGGNPDHMDAEKWLMAKTPTPFDKLVIIGHSYGGNRARLFVEQLKKNQGLIADLLVTVDPIEWSACSIINAVAANNPFSAAASACNQTSDPSSKIPVSSARSSFSFYQTIGVMSVFPYVMGYCDPGPCSSSSTTDQLVNADHLDIDKDSGVHLTINQLMLNLIRNPSVVPTASSPTRNGGQLVVPMTLSVTGMSTATDVQITSAALNGVSAQNLVSLSNLGDLPPGSAFQVSLAFPGTAAQSGETVMLVLNGEQTAGLKFTFSKRLTVP